VFIPYRHEGGSTMADKKNTVSESISRLENAQISATEEVATTIMRLGDDPESKDVRAALEEGLDASLGATEALADVMNAENDGQLQKAKENLHGRLRTLTASVDSLPETQRCLEAMGKKSTADLDQEERGRLWNSLVDRFRPAVTQGYLSDLGLSSVDELDDAQRDELERRIEEQTAKWRRR